jgi:hypothetical protein
VPRILTRLAQLNLQQLARKKKIAAPAEHHAPVAVDPYQQRIFGKGNLWEQNLVDSLEAAGLGKDGKGMTAAELFCLPAPGHQQAFVHHFRSATPAGFYGSLPRDLVEFRTFEPDFLVRVRAFVFPRGLLAD